MFLRGVETGGLGRRVDGDPGGLVAGGAPDRHGAGRVRVGRGHEGVLTEEDGEGLVRKVVARGEPAAFGPVRRRQEGRDGGVVRGVVKRHSKLTVPLGDTEN